MLVNLRCRACSQGLGSLTKPSLLAVAKAARTKLNIAMVEELLDKQSNGFAGTTFSENVEKELIRLGFVDSASVVRLI